MGGSGEKTSSKALAKSWPCPKCQDFEAALQVSATNWFAARHYPCHSKYSYAREHQGALVLLSDDRSPVFWSASTEPGAASPRGLMPFLLTLLPEHLRASVVPISVQRLVRAIEQTGRHRDWVGEFRIKYGLRTLAMPA